MEKKYITVIHNYFSDYVKWILLVSFLFLTTLVITIAFIGINEFFWIIPVSFIVIYLFSAPLFMLYRKVKKDIKECNIEQITICSFTINHDKSFNFKNSGGTTIGKNKYRIIDENNNFYLISASNDKGLFMDFHSNPSFSLEVKVLKNSRLVLQMRIIENTQRLKNLVSSIITLIISKKYFVTIFNIKIPRQLLSGEFSILFFTKCLMLRLFSI